MKTNNITFDQAFSYIYEMREFFNITKIAKELKISRITLSTSLNGTKDKNGKPNKLPKKYHQKVIDFVSSIQLESKLHLNDQ